MENIEAQRRQSRSIFAQNLFLNVIATNDYGVP